jgi:cleavage and polyadenylation specificity factor subunit 5
MTRASATRRSTRGEARAREEEAVREDEMTTTTTTTDDADAREDDDGSDDGSESESDGVEIELRDDIDVVAEHERAEAEKAEKEAREEEEARAANANGDGDGDGDGGEEESKEDGGEGAGGEVIAAAGSRGVVDVHALSRYTFGTKRARGEKDATTAAKLLRMKAQYEREGKRRSVGGICMVSQHRTPHILLLQITPTSFKLPGGKLRAGEGDVEGLARKLRNKLQPELEDGLQQYEFDIGDQAATWYRTAYEPQLYPYLPAHITKPKEEYKLFVVHLPEKCYFAVPKNLKLLAVPLFELYGNPQKYGPEIASIPHLLSRYRLNLD